MGKPTYWEQLKDPRWQRKRPEVMNLSGFACEECGAKDKMLAVHHSYYEKGLSPWEYPAESLHCLCDDCHKKAQNLMTLMQRQIGRIGVSGDMETLYGVALAIESHQFPMVPLDVFSYEVALGVGLYWGLDADAVLTAREDGVLDGNRLSEMAALKREGRNQ